MKKEPKKKLIPWKDYEQELRDKAVEKSKQPLKELGKNETCNI